VRAFAAILIVLLVGWLALRETDGASRRARSDDSEAALGVVERGTVPQDVPGTDPTATTAKDKRVRGRVRVLGPGGVPIEGIDLTPWSEGRMRYLSHTDRDGWAVWEAPELDSEAVVTSPLDQHSVPLRVPDTILRHDDLIPLEVIFVDARSGGVLEGGSARWFEGPEQSGAYLTAPVTRGIYSAFPLEIEPPSGMIGRHGLYKQVGGFVSALAQRVRLRIPVWPALQVTLELDGEGPSIVKCELGHEAITDVKFRTDAAGDRRIEGIPAIPGAVLNLRIEVGGITVDRCGRVAANGTIRLVPGTLPPIGFDDDIEWEEDPMAKPGPGVTVHVRVLHSDGSPAVGIQGELQRARTRSRPDDGILAFRDLQRVKSMLRVYDPGWGVIERMIQVDERPVQEHVCARPPTRTVRVEVVGADGRGVPAARIEALCNGFPFAPAFPDGAQEFAPLTGPDGRFVWHEFPEGQSVFRAYHGVREGSKSVALKGPDSIRIELR